MKATKPVNKLDDVARRIEEENAKPESCLSKAALARMLSESAMDLRGSTDKVKGPLYLKTVEMLARLCGYTKQQIELTTSSDLVAQLESRDESEL